MSKNNKAKPKAVPLAVPEPGDDAAERKRVLNVLAQRRYRQKRKEHIRKLEAHAADHDSRTVDESVHLSKPKHTVSVHDLDEHASQEYARAIQATDAPPELQHQVLVHDLGEDQPREYAIDDCRAMPMRTSFGALEPAMSPSDPFASYVANDLWDTPMLASFPSTPLSSSGHSSSNDETWSVTSRTQRRCLQGAPQMQTPTSQDTTYSFPDETFLEVSELALLRGCMSIARRMNIQDIMWSLSSTSPFTDPSVAAQSDHLPSNLRPTWTQMTVPHHPVVDLLPWPAARDRMIKVLSQPSEFRPPGAASPMALVDFIYDLEDSAEGVRISGSDPYSEDSWEVGEKVFTSWWWMLDRDIIRRSNELRISRGAPMLGGSILGEVA